MAYRFKAIFKRALLIVLVFLLLVLGVLGFTINYVFTPSKLTPRIVELANEYIDGTLEIGSVELTFFTSFPELSIEVKNGLITSNTGDSLASFASLDVYLNPVSFLKNEKIHVDKLHLRDPIIFTKIDSLGVSNWEIFKKTQASDTVKRASDNERSNAYVVEDIEISNGALKFQDVTNNFLVSIESMDVLGKVYYVGELIDCDLNLNINQMSLTLNEDPIINPVSINFFSKSNFALEENRLSLDTVDLKVVDHELEVASSGTIEIDSMGGVNVDLKNRLFTSNIREALDLIPIRYVNLEELKGKGKVDLKVDLLGKYDVNQFPIMVLDLEINDGEASYRDFPKKIKLFETKIGARVDYINKKTSSVSLDKLRVVSDGFSTDISGYFAQILTDPRVILKGNGTINFEDLLSTIPVQDLKARGNAEFDLQTNLKLRDILNYNYGRIDAVGKVTFRNLFLNIGDSLKMVTKKTVLKMNQEQNSTMFFSDGARLLNGTFRSNDLSVWTKNFGVLKADILDVKVVSSPSIDSTEISPLNSRIFIKDGIFEKDSLKAKLKKLNGRVNLRANQNDRTVPYIKSTFDVSNLGFDAGANYLKVNNLAYDFKSIKRDGRWPTLGNLKVEDLHVFSTSFPKLVKLKNASFFVSNDNLELKQSKIIVGRSDANLSGKIFGYQNMILNNGELKADFKVESDFLNINQITQILYNGNHFDELETDELNVSDSVNSTMQTFAVPQNVDLSFTLNVNRMKYRNLGLRRIRGMVEIKDQTLRMRWLTFKSSTGSLEAQGVYAAKNENNATVNFNTNLTDVNLSELMDILPFLDTLLTAAKDLEGTINLGIKGKAKIGKNMMVEESSLEAIARLEGENLVLLDGETFQYLAKTLKFKNREKNVLDTLAVEMAIENGSMEIFPSLITMDRYKVAVGGIQKLDLSYNYHISVLKSPLPFKTGIDITGKGEEYDYKITKAKYKYLFSDKEKHQDKVDQEMVERRNRILNRIQFDN